MQVQPTQVSTIRLGSGDYCSGRIYQEYVAICGLGFWSSGTASYSSYFVTLIEKHSNNEFNLK